MVLHLTRRDGESVNIADGAVIVTVVRARRGVVSLAFDADRDIPINRSEVQDLIDIEEGPDDESPER